MNAMKWTAGIIAALLVIFIILGVVSWMSFGMLIIAGVGIWASTKVDQKGMKSFLAIISGALILLWVYLFYLSAFKKVNIDFLGMLFKDDMSKIIFLLFLFLFILATVKNNIILYAVSTIIFLSFLGNGVVDEIINRFPDKLTPPNGGAISRGAQEFLGSAGKALEGLGNGRNQSQTQAAPVPRGESSGYAPASQVPSQELWTLQYYNSQSQLVEYRVNVSKNGDSVRINGGVINLQGNLEPDKTWYRGQINGSRIDTFLMRFTNDGGAGTMVMNGQQINFSLTRG